MPGTADGAEAAELRAENARLREAVERLGLLNEDKDAVIAGLRAQLAEQAEQIARLERLISRNSGNSSMPPSGDDQPGRKPPQPRQRQGGKKRRPGKQPGAAGAYRPWSDHPDGAISHFPEGTCGCGRDLAGARDLGVRYSHQVTDLPGAHAETIQHDRHEVECACGRSHIAGPPPEAAGAPGTVTYGLNFQAWCVFLMVMHHVPVERCADILGSMSGTRPSDGWVHALLARAATAVAAANKTIRALIILARVVCGDETPIRSGPGPKTKKRYLQVAERGSGERDEDARMVRDGGGDALATGQPRADELVSVGAVDLGAGRAAGGAAGLARDGQDAAGLVDGGVAVDQFAGAAVDVVGAAAQQNRLQAPSGVPDGACGDRGGQRRYSSRRADERRRAPARQTRVGFR